MFTSRAEYRILLRQDNADARLTERGYALGLATTDRYSWWKQKNEAIVSILAFCENTTIKPKEINDQLAQIEGCTQLKFGTKLSDLIARPQLTIEQLIAIVPALGEKINHLPDRRSEIVEEIEIIIKYKGYIDRERQIAQKMHNLENINIQGRFDYSTIKEISTEGRQKLQAIDPITLAQASRIPGVSPSDINVLLVLMHR